MFQPNIYGRSNSKTTLALAVTATLAATATHSLSSHAGNQVHPFSYEANGSCHCTEFVAISDIASTVLPTPVGGQTVAQICKRLGEGPGLILENGEYNHPAYSDAQCGNGLQAENADNSCTIIDSHGVTSCGAAGVKWDLTAAYTAAPDTTDIQENKTQVTNVSTESTALPKLADTSVGNDTIEVSENNRSLRSLASQLRAFNKTAAEADEIIAQNTQTTDAPSAQPALTIVESSFKAEPPAALVSTQDDVLNTPEATGYEIRDAEPDIAYQSGIQLSIGNTQGSTQTDSTQDSNIISADTSTLAMTQEQILSYPEIESQPIPDKITRQSGDITVVSDNAALEDRQIVIIESDGSARRMTQDEIARLPLASSETTSPVVTETTAAIEDETSKIVETPVTDIENHEPSVAAAVSKQATSSTPVEYWRSVLDYQYVGLAPTGYDFGGAGVEVEASASNQKGFSLIGNAGVADEYSEASLGLGFNFAPFKHRSTDVVMNVGVETGQFDLGITDLEDTGGFIGGYIRTRPIGRLELTGGGRYSSYFDGDAVFIASGAFRITRQFNAYSKVEVGDNDQFSFGFRYFY